MLKVRLSAFLFLACFHILQISSAQLADPIPAAIELGDIEVELTPIADGMIAPRTATYAPGDQDRIFVADQIGIVYAIDLQTGTKTVFLDISDRVLGTPGTADERGLLGLTFHPGYRTNGLFYTFSSEATDGAANFPWDGATEPGAHQSVLTEWRVNNPPNDAEVADPDSARTVLRIDQPTDRNIGGSIAFGDLELLWIGLGDGGVPASAQDERTVQGSVLRIVPNADFPPPTSTIPSEFGDYRVPLANTYFGSPELLDEIYSYGYRNPQVSIDADSGRAFAADIGGNGIQEVSNINQRTNASYPIKEGRFCVLESGGVGPNADCQVNGLANPFLQYDQDEGDAIVGGFDYSGSRLDPYTGYIFGDTNGRLFYQEGFQTIREFPVFGTHLHGKRLLGMGQDSRYELYALINDTGTLSGTSGQLLRISPLSAFATALLDWAAVMNEFYTERGDATGGAAFVDGLLARWYAAEQSGDEDGIRAAQFEMNRLIGLVTWATGRWGSPVLSADLADRMIAATRTVADSFGIPPPAEGGLLTMQSAGVDRTFYLALPSDYETTKGEKPLIVAYHGTGGSHTSWVESGDPLDPRTYNLADVVGDDAIMVFPNGLPNWNFTVDIDFFADLIDELDERGISYDRNRLFVLGHSNGGGLTAEIGCQFGDIVRAIGISAGSLTSNQCVGATAVMQRHGTNDPIVAVNTAETAHNFYTLYNGWDLELSIPMAGAFSAWSCINHSLLPIGSTDYPVVWCLDDSFHPMPDGDTTAFWEFFSNLPEAEPSNAEPPGGGNARVDTDADTTISFTLNYPSDIGRVISGAITLYPSTHCRGQFAAPLVFLNPNWLPGTIEPGDTVTYQNVPITFTTFGEVAFPADFQLQFSVYVEGGTRPIPTIGIDHDALVPITVTDTTTPIVLPTPLDVRVVEPFMGCP